MSFSFNWPRFSDQFHSDAIQMLNTALNKGNKPPIIADRIEVVELEMGTQPPELEIRDIGDLTVDQFRGIFRLTYSGDAHLVLKTKVQANPLNHKQPDIHLMTGSRGMLAAKQPLVVPMLLRLSHFRLSSYVVLVVSKQKGITLVFKTDPLQNVDINSTFDSIAVIQKFIQREIEGQLRQMFREDLPGIIHRLSQQWVKAKVEAPYLNKRFPPATPTTTKPQTNLETMSSPDLSAPLSAGPSLGPPHFGRAHSLGTPTVKRPRSVSGDSVSSRRASSAKLANGTRSPSSQTSSPDPNSSNEYENFDPTYGLRPEGLPTKSGFKGFSSLFTPNKGLADLTEEPSGDEDEAGEDSSSEGDYEDDGESTSFDVIEWEDTVPGISPPRSVVTERERDRGNTPEYETIPAVGGGSITRPRILHSQSTIQPPSGITPRLSLSNSYSRSQGNIRSGYATPSILTRQHSAGSSYFPDVPSPLSTSRTAPPTQQYYASRPRTPEAAESTPLYPSHLYATPHRPTRHSNPTIPSQRIHQPPPRPLSQDLDSSPIYIRRPNSERRLSISSSVSHQSAITTTTTSLYPNNAINDPITSTFGTSPNANFTSFPSHGFSDLPTSNSMSSSNPNSSSKIIRPSLNNNSIHHLSTLSHSNHTLSPYTRSLSHFTVRSVPPRTSSGGSGGGGLSALGGHHSGGGGAGGHGHGHGHERQQPVKAKRKRIFRIGGKKSTDSLMTASSSALPGNGGNNAVDGHDHTKHLDPRVAQWANGLAYTPTSTFGSGPNDIPLATPDSTQQERMHYLRQHQFVPSEFDAEDMDRYFRSNDDLSSVPPPPSSSMGVGPVATAAAVAPPSTVGSPPRLSTLQAVQQHIQQVQQVSQVNGLGSASESFTGGSLPAGSSTGGGSVRRRQTSSSVQNSTTRLR